MQNDAAKLLGLFETKPEFHDDAWRDRLNAAFWRTRLGTFTPHVMQNSTTGFYSFRLGQDERDGGQQPVEPAFLVDYAIEHGIGMILWPSDLPQPIWQFSHGDILSYRLYGTAYAPRFWNAPPDEGGREILAEAEEVFVGAPNEEMFPPLVRNAVRRVMRDVLKIAKPKVMLLQRKNQPSRLIFNLTDGDFGGDAGIALAFAQVSWCIPSCIPIYRIDSMVGDASMQPF